MKRTYAMLLIVLLLGSMAWAKDSPEAKVRKQLAHQIQYAVNHYTSNPYMLVSAEGKEKTALVFTHHTYSVIFGVGQWSVTEANEFVAVVIDPIRDRLKAAGFTKVVLQGLATTASERPFQRTNRTIPLE
jgi:hypothetical protein